MPSLLASSRNAEFPFDQSPRLAGTASLQEISNVNNIAFPFDQSPRLAGTNSMFVVDGSWETVSIRSKSPTSRDLVSVVRGGEMGFVSIRSKSPTSRDTVMSALHSPSLFPFDQSPRLAGTHYKAASLNAWRNVSIRSKSPTSRDNNGMTIGNLTVQAFPFDQSPRLAGTRMRFILMALMLLVSFHSIKVPD